ncbi:MAG: DUF4388 domain-containing protein [Cyanobacteria bacterium P01_F01_bin.150]
MTLSGRLSTFSLSDIAQVIDRGKKTGCLALKVLPDAPEPYNIWFEKGRIVAISNSPDQLGLIQLLKNRKWISNRVISDLKLLNSLSIPLGIYLESQGSLRPEHLRFSFQIQVIHQLCGLFQFSDGVFQFKTNIKAPKVEMTGFSISISEATLIGFRRLKNWRLLEVKLPRLDSVLSKSPIAHLALKLDPLEKRIWDLSNGTVPLSDIVQYVSQPPTNIQRAAFRLLIAGLVVDLPPEATLPQFNLVNKPIRTVQIKPIPTTLKDAKSSDRISSSFLQNLLGFLRSKS